MSGPMKTSKSAPACAPRRQRLEGWPPNTREFVVEQKSEIFMPAPFSPKLEPRQLGGIYEIRMYTMRRARSPRRSSAGPSQIAERIKLSPLAFAGHSELGGLNLWCHIWAYKDAAERFAVRDEARREGHLAAAGRRTRAAC